LSREEALLKLNSNAYSGNEIEADMEYILKKLGLSKLEFDKIMNSPVVSHLTYPNNNKLFQFLKKFS
jgi:hypothetical protein